MPGAGSLATDSANSPDAPPAALPPSAIHGIALRTTVEVHAITDRLSTDQDSPQPYHATANEIMASAGTHGDLSRYLQVLPGVVFNNDYSDDLIVRGGNPLENLFLVDGIEIPNINHIASQGTTGGLASMIDTAATQGIDFYTGAYDASYDERLSSVVNIHTLLGRSGETHLESDLGFIGLGGVAVTPLGQKNSLLVAAHRSLLNLVTNDIGLGGTPVYSNLLVRDQFNPNRTDAFTVLSLSGFDSIHIVPGGWKGVGTGANGLETSTINMQYAGWRTTNGLLWHHTFTNRQIGIFTVTDSEQQEDIQQQDQFYQVQHTNSVIAQTFTPVPVYTQSSRDGRTSLKYDLILNPEGRWSMIAGTSANLNHVNYRIAQPLGEQSPLSTNPANSDADSFSPDFLSGETGSYAEFTVHPTSRWSISGGGRLQTFASGRARHCDAAPLLRLPYLGAHCGPRSLWRVCADAALGLRHRMAPELCAAPDPRAASGRRRRSLLRLACPVRRRSLSEGLPRLSGFDGVPFPLAGQHGRRARPAIPLAAVRQSRNRLRARR